MSDNRDSFLLALDALKPCLGELVISGGWVPYVYHRYVAATRPPEPPLGTKDVDIALRPGPSAGPSLGRVLDAARFVPRRTDVPLGRFGRREDPETVYELERDGVGIELTFMAPRLGGDERPAAALACGVTATLIRYVEVLLESTLPVRIADRTAGGLEVDVMAVIPAPEAYVYQKGLSFVNRASPEKKAKDLYYLYDLLANYPELSARCAAEIPRLQQRFHPKWYAAFLRNLEDHFRTPESEGAVLVAEQKPGRDADAAFRALASRTFRDFLARLGA